MLSFDQLSLIFSSFSNEYLIIEFIPITDNKVQILTKAKSINLMDYNEDHLIKSLSSWFIIREVNNLKKSGRSLFLLEKIKQ
jgi:hypothetical protein